MIIIFSTGISPWDKNHLTDKKRLFCSCHFESGDAIKINSIVERISQKIMDHSEVVLIPFPFLLDGQENKMVAEGAVKMLDRIKDLLSLKVSVSIEKSDKEIERISI